MAIDRFAARVCRTIRAARREDETGGTVDRLIGQPGMERRAEVEAAAAKGWLAFGDEAANFALLLDRAT
jgi:hypothetical protein